MDRITKEEVHSKIQAAIGGCEELLIMVKKQKLRWYGHVSKSSGLARAMLQGTVNEKRRCRREEVDK